MKTNKPGQGRKSLPEELKKKRFTVWLNRDFLERFKNWCSHNNTTHREGLEYCCRKATEDFKKDID